ncbi:sce7726 family protein [Deinococcus xianganensis]|uniref:Sce7726 family protein n=2 Tax=Deinococcus xianganensis TaxID=1507289 RepID=A0A6I4YVP6_9DEIO|nr:sce7726 family protein [Deinococcus xianganensis]
MASHPASWAIPEINILSAEGFSGRADLCVIPDGSRSIGYEIKTEKDSLSRLAHQVRMYDHCFAERVLATTPRHLGEVCQLLPETWGLIVLGPVSHEVVELKRWPQPQDKDLAAGHLILETLRVEELNALLHNLRVTRTHTMNNDQRRALLNTHYDVATLRELAFHTLAARQGGRVHATRVETS